MKRTLVIAALGFFAFAGTAAIADDGYVTRDVSLRAGPDSSYPRIVRLRGGTPVTIEGCVDGWSWCDVFAQGERGWIAGDYLQQDYDGRRVRVPEYGVQIGIPVVSFVFGSYWDDHYRNRSWYGNRRHWSQVQPHYPVYRREGSHGNSYGNSHDRSNWNSSNSNSRRASTGYGQSRGASSHRSHDNETQRPVANTGYRGRTSGAAMPSHPVAERARPQPRSTPQARPMAQRAAAPRSEAQRPVQRTVQARKAVAPAPVRKDKSEKSRRDHDEDKDRR